VDHLQRIKDEFTRQADTFAASPAITDMRLAAPLVDAMARHADGSILDVACGPGIVTAALAASVREVVALDLTPEMLEKARQRCGERGLANVAFEQGSATALPFADAAFDGVVTRLSIHHFAEARRVLDEIFRVLKPGGTFALADVVSSETPQDSELQNAIEVLRDPSHVRMLPASALAALVAGPGFAIERQATWDQRREFEEWAAIVRDPERIAPLRTIVRALARAGEHAGMGLSATDGTIAFVHHWQLIVARKPGSSTG
jgi:ubiquinone/menaquinone biosynthesis C-methylase UbiE